MICPRCKRTTYPLQSVKLDTTIIKTKNAEQRWHDKTICSNCYYDVQELKFFLLGEEDETSINQKGDKT